MRLFNSDITLALDTIEGLHEYLLRETTKPELMTMAEYHALDETQRSAFNERRLSHLSGNILVQTAQLQAVTLSVRRALLSNRQRSSGRDSVLISGHSTMGKTTACLAAMSYVFSRYVDEVPEWEKLGHVPVVFIDVPATATAKTMMGRFLEFYGVPVPIRMTLEERTRLVVSHLVSAKTRLIIVDEVHNLSHKSQAVAGSIEVLKGLANEVPATFVFSGINIHAGQFVAGERGRQFTARSRHQVLTPYGFATPEQRAEWRRAINAFESNLLLLNHPKGSLAKHAKYLHDRTGGAIGSLARLLTGAAEDIIWEQGHALQTGAYATTAFELPEEPEQLTLRRLQETELDLAADIISGMFGAVA